MTAKSFLAVAFWPAMILILLQTISLSHAQSSGIRFQIPQVRITVPVGSTNTTVITGFPSTNNSVILVNAATNAIFDVAGLPAGAGVALTDDNGNPLNSISASTPVWITLYTTNIAEGVYTFTLDAQGTDTNGLPVTNSMPFVLQSAYIWKGGGLGAAGFGVSNNWANAASWQGGVTPGAADDVVFSDSGSQTNTSFASGIPFTNILITSSLTVGSIRFNQNTYTDSSSTNPEFHTILMSPGTTLSVTGSHGFSLLRDYVNDFGVSPDSTMGVNFEGSVNSTLLVSNKTANFAILLGNSEQPTLSISNLGNLFLDVNQVGIANYEVYPNYRGINGAYNGGRTPDTYNGYPRRMIANVYLARTNYIIANYKNADNYTNEFTRDYALMIQNNEQSGNGSSVNTFFYMGRTNVFNLDSICFIGSSSAGGNSGGTKFLQYNDKVSTNPAAYFRNSDGVSRMSIFTVSDDGGTNEADSNVKSTVDFTYAGGTLQGQGAGSGYINLLADKMFVARDRTMIASNQSPNVQGDLIIGNGLVNLNSMYLGDQEHSNKVDWTTLYGASAYLNYCQGRLVLTNNGYLPSTISVNSNITLGYTADNNPTASAQQYNTYGEITIYSNVTLQANNIICDGGLNYYDANGRLNNINVNRGGTLIVTNTIGYPNPGANDFSAADPRGIYLDSLSLTAGKLGIFANPLTTNVYTRTFSASGTIPSVIKVMGVSGVSSYPVQFPVISYVNASSPFINADVSSLGAGYFGYVLNDSANSTVDLFLTTNGPNTLLWTGAANNQWDSTSKNWVTVPGGVQTNFTIGDVVVFDDSSSVTNVAIVGTVVPSETGTGITITNSVNQYTFSGGTVGGTALLVKQGTNLLTFNATEQGPIDITSGSLVGNGNIGTTTISTNVVLNYSGTINGGLTSTGTVVFAGTETGPISIQGGTVDNSGTMSTTSGQIVTMAVGTALTNEVNGTINVGTLPVNASLNFNVPNGSTIANFGLINIWQPKMSVEGLLYGTGTISYPNGGGFDSIANTSDPRLVINSLGVLSPGPTPANSIGTMNLYCRFDFNNDVENGQTAGAGVSTVRIDVDFNNPATNDVINCDRWNNCTGFLLMTNINPSAGTFQLGQNFTVLANSSGQPFNFVDTPGYYPTMMPYVPGNGLQWSLTNFALFGSVSVVQSPNVWDGVSSVNWSTNVGDVSWKTGQAFADNQGAIFDDSASGSTTVNLAGNVAPESYVTTTVTNVNVGVSTNIVITTNYPAVSPGIVVSNSLLNYVIAGPGHIRGMTGLYKTGPGTLTLLTSNDFTGNVIVDNGTLAISNYLALGSIVSLGITGSGQNQNDIILDGGTLNYVGTTNVNLSIGKGEGMVLNAGGGTIQVTSPTNFLALNKGVSGVGALTKTGPGTMIMESTVAAYPGGTTVNAGTLELTAAALGYGPLTLNNSAIFALSSVTLTNTVNIAGPSTTILLLTNSTDVLSGPLIGSGYAQCVETFPSNLLVFNGDISGFSGTLAFGGSVGVCQFNNATNKNPCTGSLTATFDLGTASAKLDNLNGAGLTYNLGALMGGANTTLTGRPTNNAATPGTTYSIGANSLSTTFAGTISNGFGADTISIVKVGTGALLLNGNSTYTGPTTVSSGTLGGTGSITSPLTLTASGTLAPGASSTSVGTFTVNSTANLQGAVILKLNQSGPTASNDEVVVTGALTASGTLAVTSIGGTIANGTTFQLFNQPVSGFSSVTLPSGGGAYNWNNNLSVNGSITLASGGAVNTSPVSLSTSLSGKNLTLSWPANHLGWRLLVQTNALNVGINNNNWFTVVGSTGVTSVPVTIDPTAPTVFYRLVYP